MLQSDQVAQNVVPGNGQWKKYFVYLAGDTGGAHQDFLLFVNQARQSQVFCPQDSDYILVFCPVLSDAAADIQRALEYIPAGKPTVLLMMHHTNRGNQDVPQSRVLVNNPNVYLILDLLHHQGKLNKCYRNKMSTIEILKFIGDSYQVYARKVCCRVEGDDHYRDDNHFYGGARDHYNSIIIDKLRRQDTWQLSPKYLTA